MVRKYTKEFKEAACDLVTKEKIKHAVVAEKLGMKVQILYRWIDEKETYGEEAFVGKGKQRTDDAELKKLKKENEKLRNEVEILKKAAAYFAKDREIE